jgi:hypothetical protein
MSNPQAGTARARAARERRERRRRSRDEDNQGVAEPFVFGIANHKVACHGDFGGVRRLHLLGEELGARDLFFF